MRWSSKSELEKSMSGKSESEKIVINENIKLLKYSSYLNFVHCAILLNKKKT